MDKVFTLVVSSLSWFSLAVIWHALFSHHIALSVYFSVNAALFTMNALFWSLTAVMTYRSVRNAP